MQRDDLCGGGGRSCGGERTRAADHDRVPEQRPHGVGRRTKGRVDDHHGFPEHGLGRDPPGDRRFGQGLRPYGEHRAPGLGGTRPRGVEAGARVRAEHVAERRGFPCCAFGEHGRGGRFGDVAGRQGVRGDERHEIFGEFGDPNVHRSRAADGRSASANDGPPTGPSPTVSTSPRPTSGPWDDSSIARAGRSLPSSQHRRATRSSVGRGRAGSRCSQPITRPTRGGPDRAAGHPPPGLPGATTRARERLGAGMVRLPSAFRASGTPLTSPGVSSRDASVPGAEPRVAARTTSAAAASRRETPSLRSTAWTWLLTVDRPMNNCLAISPFVRLGADERGVGFDDDSEALRAGDGVAGERPWCRCGRRVRQGTRAGGEDHARPYDARGGRAC